MARTIDWTAGNGSQIAIVLSVEFEFDLQGRRKDHGRKVIDVCATIDGDHEGGNVQLTNHPTAVAKCGRIGLSRANYDRYLSVRDELTAEIAGHNADCDIHAEKLDRMSAESSRII